MKKRTKKIIGGVITGLIVLAGVFLLSNKIISPEAAQNRIAYLPNNYSRQNVDREIPPSTPIMTEKKDKSYEFNGHTYSIRLEIDKPYFPYMLGGKVTGTITLLKDGKPTKELPKEVRDNYAPNRPNDPLIAQVIVDGLTVPHKPNDYSLTNTPQSYYQPVITNTAYLYSPQTITVTADNSLGTKFTTTAIDLSAGRATFELINGGCKKGNSVVDIQIAGSIGALPEGDWKKAMMYTDKNLVTEDKTRDFVELPDLNTTVKSAIYYDLKFDPPFVAAKQNQEVKITVTAYDTKTNQPYAGIDHKVILVSHPIRKYWAYVGVGKIGCLSPNAGEFVEADKSPNPSFVLNSYRRLGITATEVTLKQGKGEATFTYNGEQWLTPEINFSVLSSDAAKWINTVETISSEYGYVKVPTDRTKFDTVVGGATDKYANYNVDQLWQAFLGAPSDGTEEKVIISKLQDAACASDYTFKTELDNLTTDQSNSMEAKLDKLREEVIKNPCAYINWREPAKTDTPIDTNIAPFPYTTKSLEIRGASVATSETNSQRHLAIWWELLIYQLSKIVLGGLTIYVIRRRALAKLKIKR